MGKNIKAYTIFGGRNALAALLFRAIFGIQGQNCDFTKISILSILLWVFNKKMHYFLILFTVFRIKSEIPMAIYCKVSDLWILAPTANIVKLLIRGNLPFTLKNPYRT